MGNGELMVPGGLSLSLLGHYQSLPLVLNDGEQKLEVVRDRVTSLLSASYGVLPWLELSAKVPVVLWQQGDDPQEAGLARLAAQGLGTPVLQARLGLLSRRHRKPVDLAADLAVGLPFGAAEALAGDSGPRFQARMTAGTTIGWVQPSVEAGVLFRPPMRLATALGPAKPNAVAEVQLATSVTTTGKAQRGELGLRVNLGTQVSMDLVGGIRFPLLAGLDAFVLGGPGLGGAIGAPRFRMVAGITFRNEPPPKLSYLDEDADRELQLELATPAAIVVNNPLRATPTWDLQKIDRAEEEVVEDEQRSGPRPYQPGPNEKLVLRGDIQFARGSSELAGVVPLLDQAVLRLMERARNGTILIEAHSDSEGTEWSDVTMSMRRAQAVRRYLIAQGVPSHQVRIQSFGADWPISPNPATEQEHQLNRRAEVLVLTHIAASTPTPPPAP